MLYLQYLVMIVEYPEHSTNLTFSRIVLYLILSFKVILEAGYPELLYVFKVKVVITIVTYVSEKYILPFNVSSQMKRNQVMPMYI